MINSKIIKHEIQNKLMGKCVFFLITFMAAEKLDRMNKMGMESCCPSHSGSSDASLNSSDHPCIPLELTATDLRLVLLVMINFSRQLQWWRWAQICHFKPETQRGLTGAKIVTPLCRVTEAILMA